MYSYVELITSYMHYVIHLCLNLNIISGLTLHISFIYAIWVSIAAA